MTLTVRLDASIESALTSFCNNQAFTKSQVVHQALGNWLDAQSVRQGHALLAFVPHQAPTPKRASPKPAPRRERYEPYSKMALRAKVLAAQAGKPE